jgi:LysM repeat protein
MGQFGYDFYFTIGEEVLTLPITPSSLNMKVGSNNKVVTLINEGDVNILKSPSLVEFEFDARFPMRDYPYSRKALNFETYMNKFTALMTEKTPFVFSVVRTTPNGKGTWGTTRKVTLEELEINEDADEGDDVIVSFTLKEYKDYGVVTIKTVSVKPTTTSTSEQPRSTETKAVAKQKEHTIRSGDTLWAIAKQYYGDGSKYTVIYEANKSVIEAEAKSRGMSSSSNGHWIFPNTVLVIPNL